jgi:hypothetical protein
MTLLSFPLFSFAGLRGLPGLAPAGEVLFFASPKQSTQKKGEPGASSLRCAPGTLRCSAAAGSAETRPAGSNICASVSAAACATRLRTRRWGAEDQNRMPQGRAMARLCGVRLLAVGFPAVGRAEQRRDEGIKRRACLSPQGEFARLPLVASSARNPAWALTPARLFFGNFLLAKQKKVTALPGAYPGNAALPGHYAESKV